MTDRPINFPAPMIRALLDGRKTQTRRVLKPKWRDGANQQFTGWRAEQVGPRHWQIIGGMGVGANIKTPCAVGDRLYVREAACWVSAWGWRYRADNDDLTEKRADGEVGKWRPPILMPRWASRLTLTVTDVRVQRLNEIIRGDAMAEGCPHANMAGGPDPRDWFAELWNSLHGPDAWDANPWVAALSFTVQRGNIDQIGGDA
jgi:hypothetical protein